jgi:5-methylcytosine-specific restriction endonuclease McrA
VRLFVLLRDGFRCRYCGAPLTEGTFTLDHLIPRCQGGSNRIANLAACCVDCNKRKGRQSLRESGLKLRPSPLAVSLTRRSRH